MKSRISRLVGRREKLGEERPQSVMIRGECCFCNHRRKCVLKGHTNRPGAKDLAIRRPRGTSDDNFSKKVRSVAGLD